MIVMGGGVRTCRKSRQICIIRDGLLKQEGTGQSETEGVGVDRFLS